MLLVTIESKGDCVESVDLSEKCYLVHYQVETIKNSTCNIELRRQSNGLRTFFASSTHFQEYKFIMLTQYCIPSKRVCFRNLRLL